MPDKKTDEATEIVESMERENGAKLRRYIARLLRSSQGDAEDVLQDAYERILKYSRSGISQPVAYVYKVINSLISAASKQKEREVPLEHDPLALEDVGSEQPQPEEIEITRQTVIDHLRQLDDAHRTVLWMQKAEGYPVKEIAQETGMDEWRVRKYLVEAKAKLREAKRSR